MKHTIYSDWKKIYSFNLGEQKIQIKKTNYLLNLRKKNKLFVHQRKQNTEKNC